MDGSAEEGWIAVGPLHDLPDARGVAVTIANRRVALFRLGDEVLAIENRCPHRGFPLHDGIVDSARVRCRTHGSVFDLRTGARERGPAACGVEVYRVEVIAGVVRVQVPS